MPSSSGDQTRVGRTLTLGRGAESSLDAETSNSRSRRKTSVLRPMISARTARIDDNLERGTDGSNPLPSATESVSPVPAMASRRKGPAFPGSVSLDETREWDVLAASRLASSLFL